MLIQNENILKNTKKETNNNMERILILKTIVSPLKNVYIKLHILTNNHKTLRVLVLFRISSNKPMLAPYLSTVESSPGKVSLTTMLALSFTHQWS